MATLKIKFRASSRPGNAGTLFFQIIHNRVVRQIYTGVALFPCEWNAEDSSVVVPGDCDEERRAFLTSLRDDLSSRVSRLSSIIDRLDKEGIAYNADRVVELYKAPDTGDSFISFAEDLVEKLAQSGSMQMAGKYATSLSSFKRFRVNRDILLRKLDAVLISEYENWLKKSGVCRNTISFYMRNLRAVYNRAVENQLVQQSFPFRHVYTGVEKTAKRAISLQSIRRIRDLDLMTSPALDFARNMFLFSFFTRGMSFVDMAYLRKKDLKNGILTYRRRKTGQQLLIKWEKCMQEIADKYDTGTSEYLLPIIKRDCDVDDRRQYIYAAHNVNRALKIIGNKLGLSATLTTYTARHAWASIARSKNVPLSVISEGMGHDSEATTRIYLASLDTAEIDKANKLIINSL